jgi:hypothetical protein
VDGVMELTADLRLRLQELNRHRADLVLQAVANLPDHVRYVEAPNSIEPRDGEDVAFLAGGVPWCPPWHADGLGMLSWAKEPLLIVSPARGEFDVSDPELADAQVEWEISAFRKLRSLRLAGFRVVTQFWFPACDPMMTVQPTSLLELGKVLASNGPLTVGVENGYPLPNVVYRQVRLERPASVTVRTTLWDTCQDTLLELYRQRGH